MQGEIHELIDAQIGRKVRERRLLLGLSQRELASSLGISAQQMAKYENGVSSFSVARLYQVSRRLNTPLASLFADVGQDDGESDTDTLGMNGHVSRDIFEVVRSYCNVSDARVQRALRSLIAQLAEGEEEKNNAESLEG